MTPLATLVRSRIDAIALVRARVERGQRCRHPLPRNGSQVNDGRAVTGIDYAAYEGMALRELQANVEEGAERFETPDVVVEHRLGELQVEEISVGIAVGHPHRDAAYGLSRWVIEELKRRVPIWKREHYADGTREWVDPSGRTLRREARDRAARPVRRTIEYLRISVTDRCNFRCSYCMPIEGLPWLPKSDILSYEEIADVVRQLAPLGLRRVRITGGERPSGHSSPRSSGCCAASPPSRHRALDERVRLPGARARARRRGARPREHVVGQSPSRSHRIDRATRPALRSRRRG
jgi:molybdopterin synthase catalytic subunit